MPGSWSVYVHTSPSGKRYVGITGKKPSVRWGGGAGYRKNPVFYRAILKYGWNNIRHEILREGLSKEEAIFWEQIYIAFFRSNVRGFGYNATAGGEGCNGTPRSEETKALLRERCCGWKHTPEAKAKISQRSKELWDDPELRARMTRQGPDHWNFGKKRSPETIAKMVAGRAGYKHTDEWKAWARERFSGPGNPNYGRKFGEGFCQFQSRKMTALMQDPARRARLRDCFERKQVAQYTLDGALVSTYDGLHEAERATGVPAGNISQCCRGKRKSSGGFIWRYSSSGQ